MRNEKGQFVKGSNGWLGRKHTLETLEKLRVSHMGKPGYWAGKSRPVEENSAAWKGDGVGYVGLHMWVYRNLGKPDTCEHCNTNGLSGSKIHWANKSQEYKRELDDWIRLCVSCHKTYDSNKLVCA